PKALSAVPPTVLLDGTLRVTTAFAASQAAVIPAHVLALTEGVRGSMFVSQWKFVLFVLIAVGMSGTGAGLWTYQARALEPAAEKEGARPAPPPPPATSPAPPKDPNGPPVKVGEASENFEVLVANVPERERMVRIARLVAEAAEKHRKE